MGNAIQLGVNFMRLLLIQATTIRCVRREGFIRTLIGIIN